MAISAAVWGRKIAVAPPPLEVCQLVARLTGDRGRGVGIRPNPPLPADPPPFPDQHPLAEEIPLDAEDKSVYFADLVGALAKAEREGNLREKIRLFCRFALLIVDEIGYMPVIPGGGDLFF